MLGKINEYCFLVFRNVKTLISKNDENQRKSAGIGFLKSVYLRKTLLTKKLNLKNKFKS